MVVSLRYFRVYLEKDLGVLLNYRKFGLVFSLLLGLNLLVPCSVFAGSGFQLSPNLVELEPVGAGVSKNFSVTSTGDEPVAVQVRMVKREIMPDGKEVRFPEENDFLVYPPQMVLEPDERQLIKVVWVGDTALIKELAYRAIVEQVPVNLTPVKVENSGGIPISITIISTYVASVYVKPPGATAKIVLEGVSSQKSKEGTDQLVLNFANQGTAHELLSSNLKVTVTASSGQKVTLAGEQLKDVIAQNILPGNKRQFILPWPKELPVGPVTATFDTTS
jgi:fimbrial chaperone protein